MNLMNYPTAQTPVFENSEVAACEKSQMTLQSVTVEIDNAISEAGMIADRISAFLAKRNESPVDVLEVNDLMSHHVSIRDKANALCRILDSIQQTLGV